MADASENGFRFERKYHITDLSFGEVEQWVRHSPAGFQEIYSTRTINNIYLDTPRLDSYFENVGGLSERTKLRIRWYGALLGPIAKPVLEFKIKRGMVGTKDSHPLAPFRLEPGFGIADLERLARDSVLPARVRAALEDVEPSMINRYHRRYFLSADGTYRVTLDWGLEFYRVDRHDNRFTCRNRLPDSTVMELKYAGEIADIDERIANFFPFRVTRMSKYVTGVEAVEG